MAKLKDIQIRVHTRACTVNGENGYFHLWEQYSQPVGESPLIGGPPAGVISQVFGIVEFEDGVRRVQPYDIKFCDDEHMMIHEWNESDKYFEQMLEKDNDK